MGLRMLGRDGKTQELQTRESPTPPVLIPIAGTEESKARLGVFVMRPSQQLELADDIVPVARFIYVSIALCHVVCLPQGACSDVKRLRILNVLPYFNGSNSDEYTGSLVFAPFCARSQWSRSAVRHIHKAE